MSDNSDLLLVSNRCSKTSLVFEARAYKLKHRQTEEISGMFQSVHSMCIMCLLFLKNNKIGCRGAMYTNLKVTDAISKKDHLETFAINSGFAVGSSCTLKKDAGVQSTRTCLWTQSCILTLMQMIAP
ncbi:hypothetical protein T09_14701 [Trichinella sp. T9]|nr:hypothetical protein T09_14701 [Trichinella sp. T9]